MDSDSMRPGCNVVGHRKSPVGYSASRRWMHVLYPFNKKFYSSGEKCWFVVSFYRELWWNGAEETERIGKISACTWNRYDFYYRWWVKRWIVLFILSFCSRELKDGPRNFWNPELIQKYIAEREQQNRYSIILTFDDNGVSGHPNHCSISKAFSEDERCWRLKSLPIWFKYLGPLGSFLASILNKQEEQIVFRFSLINAYRYGYIAMTQHESQMLWFRRLYLIFSVYMTLNILTRRKQ